MVSATERKAAAELERKRDQKKGQILSLILDREGGNRAEMEGLLIHSIDRASKSADKLSRRIFWLNLIILIVGVLALVVASYEIFYK